MHVGCILFLPFFVILFFDHFSFFHFSLFHKFCPFSQFFLFIFFLFYVFLLYLYCTPSKAILRHSKHDGKRAKLQIQMEELEARERARQPSQQPLAAPTHPQPAGTSLEMYCLAH